uniref:RNA-directed RNA polymerase L n=1 Tax=Macrotermes subhyalinus lispivirus 1 TaxID=3133482 RepID=A0AAT9JFS1_9MONO
MEELDIMGEEFSGRTKVERIPDSHLQSPIRDVYRKMFLADPAFWPPFLSACLTTIPVDRHTVNIETEYSYGYLLGSVYSYNSSIRLEWVYNTYPECSEAVSKLLTNICQELNLPLPQCRMIPTDKDMILISTKVLWDEVRSVMQDCRSGSDRWVSIVNLPPEILEMKVCSQFCLFRPKWKENEWHLFDYDQIMMVADTIAGRVFCLIYNDILPDEIPGKLPSGIIERCYQIFDSELTTNGNIAYKRIARWEPICMAVLLKVHDRLQRSNSYFEWLDGELKDDNDTNGQAIITLLLNSSLTPECLAELHGIYRHWGHPTVEEDLGCEKVRDIAQNRPIPNLSTLNKMAGALKRQFIVSFINKHGRWPKIANASALKGLAIYGLIKTQSRVINLYSPEYSLDHWGMIRFEKEFDFDYHLDYTDLLEDRSISVYRSELRGIYSSDALKYKPKRPSSDRRVLRETLKRDTINVKNICDKFQKGEIPKEWKIIIVHAKERELKIAPRLFAMMTFEARLYYSVTEANIRDHIFKYFPQQTMTLDEADLSKRLLTLTTTVEGLIKILSSLLGIDFSSWNICWTFLSTMDVFQFLDDLFGTPGLYLRTHLFFEDCLIALASHHNPPSSLIGTPDGEPRECNELWYNHKGGFEGLRQKGWTLCTIGLLLLVEATTGLKSYVIGQGDNQVCKLMIPIPDNCESVESYVYSDQQEISAKVDKFISTLRDLAGKIGLHVKMEETWVGMDVLTYGKEILYKGAFMPQGLKRISRLLTDVNEIYPTLHTKVATLQTAGMACSQKSYDIITPYFLCTVEVLMTICRDALHLNRMRKITAQSYEYFKTVAFKEFILCLCSDIGACPLLSFLSFLYRGHPDPLTTYTTWLYKLSRKSTLAKRVYLWLQDKHYIVGKGDCELLVSNPCALNIDSPETISSRIRRELETALISFTRNRDLKEIFSTASRKADSELFSYLISFDPCHPRVAHEIFRNTITGAKLSFISKFSNTRTTQTLFAEQKEPSDMIKTVKTLEIQLLNHWVSLYRQVISIQRTGATLVCPTTLAQNLRNDTWSKTTEGRPIAGVTLPHPSHQFCYYTHAEPVAHLQFKEEKVLMMVPNIPSKKLVNTRGTYPAYIGSTTREKRSGKMYSIPNASRPLKSAERLIQLRNWMTVDQSQVFQFLTSLATCRTDVPLHILNDITAPIIGGSVTHRLDDHVTKRGTLHNVRPNITTHVYYTTDTMGKFSRGLTNYNMHFQGIIHAGISYIQTSIIHGHPSDYQYTSLRYVGQCCEERLEDFFLNSQSTPPSVRISEKNPLLFAHVSVIPPAVKPENESFCRVVKSSRPAEAVGFILFSRCMTVSNIYHIGLTEQSNPLVSQVGVAEVVGAGLRDVLFHLAKYIYFYLPTDQDSAGEFFHSLPPRIFSDIAVICLLPELIHDLCSLSGFSSLPDMFCNKEVICNLLKRILERFLYDFLAFPEIGIQEAYLTVYYMSGTVGLRQIMMMWSKQIMIITSGKVDLTNLIDQAYKASPPAEFLPNADFIYYIMTRVIRHDLPYLTQLICRLCPLRISGVSPQAVSRDARSLRAIKSHHPRTSKPQLKSTTLKTITLSEPYIKTLDCSIEVLETDIVEIKRTRSLHIHVPKQRLDQTYRLLGPVSTAFLKLLEIILTEGWKLSGDAVTLAEGEGSMAELLLKMGVNQVYYNSLVKKQVLVEQRATGLIPTCLIGYPDRVKMGDLTAITGGDLSDQHVLRSILQYISSKNISIVTCDAESSSSHNQSLACKITLAWAAVCHVSKSDHALLKSFCNNADVLSGIVGTALTLYKNVKVTVPLYSSHETHEVYIVCSEFYPHVTLADILYCHSMGFQLVAKNYNSLRSPLMSFKMCRLSDSPHQEQNREKVWKLIHFAESLGFEDNLISNLHRLVLFNSVYTGGSLENWISYTQELAYSRALTCIKIQSSSYYGGPVININPEYIPKHHILHNQVESYLTCMINCRILMELLKSTKKDFFGKLTEILSGQHDLVYNKAIIYKYHLEETLWKKSYLKSVCRVWGHLSFKKYHACPLNEIPKK